MDFDFVIIGAGPAGEAAVYKALRRGVRPDLLVGRVSGCEGKPGA